MCLGGRHSSQSARGMTMNTKLKILASAALVVASLSAAKAANDSCKIMLWDVGPMMLQSSMPMVSALIKKEVASGRLCLPNNSITFGEVAGTIGHWLNLPSFKPVRSVTGDEKWDCAAQALEDAFPCPH
jgi:hypothetical protein